VGRTASTFLLEGVAFMSEGSRPAPRRGSQLTQKMGRPGRSRSSGRAGLLITVHRLRSAGLADQFFFTNGGSGKSSSGAMPEW
jgi:hypothetical protein